MLRQARSCDEDEFIALVRDQIKEAEEGEVHPPCDGVCGPGSAGAISDESKSAGTTEMLRDLLTCLEGERYSLPEREHFDWSGNGESPDLGRIVDLAMSGDGATARRAQEVLFVGRYSSRPLVMRLVLTAAIESWEPMARREARDELEDEVLCGYVAHWLACAVRTTSVGRSDGVVEGRMRGVWATLALGILRRRSQALFLLEKFIECSEKVSVACDYGPILALALSMMGGEEALIGLDTLAGSHEWATRRCAMLRLADIGSVRAKELMLDHLFADDLDVAREAGLVICGGRVVPPRETVERIDVALSRMGERSGPPPHGYRLDGVFQRLGYADLLRAVRARIVDHQRDR